MATGPADEDEGCGACKIAACIENRQREVGMAILEPGSMDLRLVQFIEPGRAYSTLQFILAEGVTDVVVSDVAPLVAGLFDPPSRLAIQLSRAPLQTTA